MSAAGIPAPSVEADGQHGVHAGSGCKQPASIADFVSPFPSTGLPLSRRSLPQAAAVLTVSTKLRHSQSQKAGIEQTRVTVLW